MKRYFITGTDTNCGKTYVTTELVRCLKEKNQKVMAIKPVASGFSLQNGLLVNEDLVALEAANGFETKAICNWRLMRPVAPHLAAEEEGIVITAKDIEQFCLSYSEEAMDCMLIEGAGGLMVPLNREETWIDFLKISKTPVILVVGLRLGCLNHALLTETVLSMHGISCVGWVANCIDNNMDMLEENIDTLVRSLQIPRLATISYAGKLHFDASMLVV